MIRTSFMCPLDYTHLFLNHFMYFMGHFVLSVDYFVNMTILPLPTLRNKSNHTAFSGIESDSEPLGDSIVSSFILSRYRLAIAIGLSLFRSSLRS